MQHSTYELDHLGTIALENFADTFAFENGLSLTDGRSRLTETRALPIILTSKSEENDIWEFHAAHAVADLIHNALTHGGANVNVHLSRNGNHSTVNIADSGPGMSADNVRYIYSAKGAARDTKIDVRPYGYGALSYAVTTPDYVLPILRVTTDNGSELTTVNVTFRRGRGYVEQTVSDSTGTTGTRVELTANSPSLFHCAALVVGETSLSSPIRLSITEQFDKSKKVSTPKKRGEKAVRRLSELCQVSPKTRDTRRGGTVESLSFGPVVPYEVVREKDNDKVEFEYRLAAACADSSESLAPSLVGSTTAIYPGNRVYNSSSIEAVGGAIIDGVYRVGPFAFDGVETRHARSRGLSLPPSPAPYTASLFQPSIPVGSVTAFFTEHHAESRTVVRLETEKLVLRASRAVGRANTEAADAGEFPTIENYTNRSDDSGAFTIDVTDRTRDISARDKLGYELSDDGRLNQSPFAMRVVRHIADDFGVSVPAGLYPARHPRLFHFIASAATCAANSYEPDAGNSTAVYTFGNGGVPGVSWVEHPSETPKGTFGSLLPEYMGSASGGNSAEFVRLGVTLCDDDLPNYPVEKMHNRLSLLHDRHNVSNTLHDSYVHIMSNNLRALWTFTTAMVLAQRPIGNHKSTQPMVVVLGAMRTDRNAIDNVFKRKGEKKYPAVVFGLNDDSVVREDLSLNEIRQVNRSDNKTLVLREWGRDDYNHPAIAGLASDSPAFSSRWEPRNAVPRFVPMSSVVPDKPSEVAGKFIGWRTHLPHVGVERVVVLTETSQTINKEVDPAFTAVASDIIYRIEQEAENVADNLKTEVEDYATAYAVMDFVDIIARTGYACNSFRVGSPSWWKVKYNDGKTGKISTSIDQIVRETVLSQMEHAHSTSGNQRPSRNRTEDESHRTATIEDFMRSANNAAGDLDEKYGAKASGILTDYDTAVALLTWRPIITLTDDDFMELFEAGKYNPTALGRAVRKYRPLAVKRLREVLGPRIRKGTSLDEVVRTASEELDLLVSRHG